MIDVRMLLGVLAISTSMAAVAETAVPDAIIAAATWKSNVEIGFVKTGGNTETETLNAKARAETEREKWRHTVNLEVLNSSDKSVATAERYILSGQSSFKMGPKNFFFVLVISPVINFCLYLSTCLSGVRPLKRSTAMCLGGCISIRTAGLVGVGTESFVYDEGRTNAI